MHTGHCICRILWYHQSKVICSIKWRKTKSIWNFRRYFGGGVQFKSSQEAERHHCVLDILLPFGCKYMDISLEDGPHSGRTHALRDEQCRMETRVFPMEFRLEAGICFSISTLVV